MIGLVVAVSRPSGSDTPGTRTKLHPRHKATRRRRAAQRLRSPPTTAAGERCRRSWPCKLLWTAEGICFRIAPCAQEIRVQRSQAARVRASVSSVTAADSDAGGEQERLRTQALAVAKEPAQELSHASRSTVLKRSESIETLPHRSERSGTTCSSLRSSLSMKRWIAGTG